MDEEPGGLPSMGYQTVRHHVVSEQQHLKNSLHSRLRENGRSSQRGQEGTSLAWESDPQSFGTEPKGGLHCAFTNIL